MVLDTGIATQANIESLDGHGWKWIAVSRETKPDPPEGDPEAVVRTQGGYDVRAWPLAQDAHGQDGPEAAADGDGRRRVTAADTWALHSFPLLRGTRPDSPREDASGLDSPKA